MQQLLRVVPLVLDGVHFGMVFGTRGLLAEETWANLNKQILQLCVHHLRCKDVKTALNYSRYFGGKVKIIPPKYGQNMKDTGTCFGGRSLRQNIHLFSIFCDHRDEATPCKTFS